MLFVLLAVAAAAPDAGPVARMSVQPMPAPKPALKYQLLPEVRELQPGNPVQWYLRSFAERRFFFFGKEAAAERTRYLTMPLADLPADKLKTYGGSALTQTDWGARLDTPDWQVLDRVQTEGTAIALPELAALRVLGSALQVRFRGEVARRDFDAAIRTAKTMLAFARHLGEHPTLAANLLGVSVAAAALDTLAEMLTRPGCPNLYWALTDLPNPLVEVRKGVQGDRAAVDVELRAVRDDGPMTDAQLDDLVGRFSGRIGFAREQAGRPPRNVRAELARQARDADGVHAARGRLTEAGLAAALVAKLPPLHVVLLDERRAFEARRDEQAKRLGLAPWQLDSLAPADEPAGELFADLLPRVIDARRAQGRIEQRIALLRHVEALRLYAADHGGKLPATLEAVGVPVPADPFTGKPFAFVLDGATALIRGGGPKGDGRSPASHPRVAVTMNPDEGGREMADPPPTP